MFSGARSQRDGVFVFMGISVLCVMSTLYLGMTFSGLHVVNPIVRVRKSSAPPSKTSTDSLNLNGSNAIIPETYLVAHAPGWTLYENLYMSNGTLYIVASEERQADIPPIRMMTSTGIVAENSPENIAMREPTTQEMQIITPEIALFKWGGNTQNSEENRVWSIEGATILVNEPRQFLAHYYHFVAEFLFGAWAFIYGAFNPHAHLAQRPSFDRANVSTPPINLTTEAYMPPSFSRIIFMHAASDGWRDRPGFNSYFLRAAFPSLDIEVSSDWDDRVLMTSHKSMGSKSKERAWHFPMVLLSDRSAAFRGQACGQRTQRIAAESWEVMARSAAIDLSGRWWSVVRENVLDFAGVKTSQAEDAHNHGVQIPETHLSVPEQITITYLVRQGGRRALIQDDHDGLVQALEEMVKRKKAKDGKEWILRVVAAETLTKDEQVELVSKTTILLGVHGNGLTHLVLMKPNRFSSVIEIFYPGGFAHDYEWTTRALGMRHYTVWNDTYLTYPKEPPLPAYPEGFQGAAIPIHGDTVAKLIEARLDGVI